MFNMFDIHIPGFAELVNELNKMPVKTDTLRMRNRKMELEKQLAKLEEGIKVFSRPKVFVKIGEWWRAAAGPGPYFFKISSSGFSTFVVCLPLVDFVKVNWGNEVFKSYGDLMCLTKLNVKFR